MGEGSHGLVYFVDDDAAICNGVEQIIKQLGHQVVCFTQSQACLDELKQRPCDVLVTDVRMEGMDGMELLSEVKKQMPWVPVLMVTGYGDVSLAVEAVKLGAADFIEKPLERELLMAVLERLMQEAMRIKERLGQTLTKTERKILHLVLEGLSSREIAMRLHRSLRTIELHRHHVMQKMESIMWSGWCDVPWTWD